MLVRLRAVELLWVMKLATCLASASDFESPTAVDIACLWVSDVGHSDFQSHQVFALLASGITEGEVVDPLGCDDPH